MRGYGPSRAGGYWSELASFLARTRACTWRAARTRIVGFIMSVLDGETALAYHIGFDRQAAGEGVPVYLRLLHASLAQAIESARGACRSAAPRSSPRRGWDASPRRPSSGRAIGIHF